MRMRQSTSPKQRTRRFEPHTETGSEHFECQGGSLTQIFKVIVSDKEKILSNINVAVLRQVKKENSPLLVTVWSL